MGTHDKEKWDLDEIVSVYFSWYMRNSEEALLRKVGDSNVVNISEAVDPKEYKVNEAMESENEWKQKRMHRQYVRENECIDWD